MHWRFDTQEDCPAAEGWKITRRDWLMASGVVAAALSVEMPVAWGAQTNGQSHLRFGIVTDAHYADAPARGTRQYRSSLPKMAECVALMNDVKVDFLIHLGDFKDQSTPALEEDTLKYLETIETVFGQFTGPRYHVLGNHDMDSISKEQFLARVENTAIPPAHKHFSFDCMGVHFVVLDANYTSDGADYDHGNFDWTDANVPQGQLDWIRKDLASASGPVIGFVHQQLDGGGSHCVKNADEVRHILQECRRVLAVFQGHNHAGDYSRIENIHYYTLKAMVEGNSDEDNAYAIVDVRQDGHIVVSGYRKAVGRELGTA